MGTINAYSFRMEWRGQINLAGIPSIITISFGNLELILVYSSRNEWALSQIEEMLRYRGIPYVLVDYIGDISFIDQTLP
jgi:hypothetical protein